MYNDYEEYMRSVLGYKTQDTYRENDDYYYYDITRANRNIQEVNKLYPEIYGIIYPMVQKICIRRSVGTITEETLTQMVDEIYNVIEPREELETRSNENQKNTDTKNTKQREQLKETRRPSQNNYLLRDLIRILIIRELLSGGGHGFFPGMPGSRWTRRKTSYATAKTRRTEEWDQDHQ